MRRLAFVAGLLAVLLLGGCTTMRSAPRRPATPVHREVASLAPAFARVDALARRHGAGNVLLVLDLDDTLLAATHALGSDAWFEWQRSLASGDPRRVARDFESLLEVQAFLHRTGSMRLTEAQLPARLAELQSRGVRSLVLTARGPAVAVTTIRELDVQGLDFRQSAPGPAGGWRDVFRPWPDARPALYWHGVYLVAGQDKGRALRVLLERLCLRPQAIVFVDDKARNVAAFADDFTACGPETWIFRYGGEDDAVAAFRADPEGALVRGGSRGNSRARDRAAPRHSAAGVFRARSRDP